MTTIKIILSISLALLAIVDSFAQNSVGLKPALAGLWVKDLENSIEWYQRILGFEIEKEIVKYPDYQLRAAFMQRGGFHLELLEKVPSFSREDVLPRQQQIGGVLKLGFEVQDINAEFTRLKQMNDVNILAELQKLPEPDLDMNWPERFFLITDPDGNYLQFFSLANSKQDDLIAEDLNPWLVMITVADLDAAVLWYNEVLDYELKGVIGEPGNRRAIMSNEDGVLELYEPSTVVFREDLPSDSTFLGFNKMAFTTGQFDLYHQKFLERKVKFAIKPEASVFDWATRSMIIKDPEMNWIQVFEVK